MIKEYQRYIYIYLPWITHPGIEISSGHRWTHIQSWLMDRHVGWLHIEIDTATSAIHGINTINNVAKCCLKKKNALGHPICGSIINLLSAWHLPEPGRWRRTWIMRLGSSQRLDIAIFPINCGIYIYCGKKLNGHLNQDSESLFGLTWKIPLHQILHLQIAYCLVPKMHA